MAVVGRERWKGVIVRVGPGVERARNPDRVARKTPPGWRELREAYPRIVMGIVLGIAVLLVTDVVLAYKRVQYGWELRRMPASMTETESGRVDAIAASEENRLASAVELARCGFSKAGRQP
jgi:hypothetical protein